MCRIRYTSVGIGPFVSIEHIEYEYKCIYRSGGNKYILCRFLNAVSVFDRFGKAQHKARRADDFLA